MAAKRNANPAVCIIRHNYYPDSHVRRDAEALERTGHDVHVIALKTSTSGMLSTSTTRKRRRRCSRATVRQARMANDRYSQA